MKNKIFLLFLLMIGLVSCQTDQPNASTKEISTEKIKSPPIQPSSTDSLLQRFENEILRFDSLDKANGISNDGILFTGSSSIRMWSTLEKDMGDMPALNRGFGGATIPEVLHFMGKYLFQHKPQIVVLYCGENDISEGASPEKVFASFQAFVKIMETRLPETKILYISMKPSIARWNLWGQYQAGEQLLKSFIDKNPNIEYMDASKTMLDKNGEIKKDIFIEDGLHMNAKGYEGWTAQILPILKKMYKPQRGSSN